MRKISVLILFFFLLVGFATASHLTFSHDDVEYSEDEIVIECDDSSSEGCPETSSGWGSGTILTISACGYGTTSGVSQSGSDYVVDDPVPYEFFCDMGHNGEITVTYQVCDPDCVVEWEESGGSLTLEAKNMDDHIGENMIVNMNSEDNELRNFQLTDDHTDWYSGPDTSGAIMIQNYGVDCGTFCTENVKGAYNVDEGPFPVWSTSGESLDDYVSGLSIEYDNTDSDLDPVTEKLSGSSTEWDYGEVEDHWDITSENPLHVDGTYEISGDVIYGNIPEYYVPDGSGGMEEASDSGEGPYFFVCREDATMTTGYLTNVDGSLVLEKIPQVVETGGDYYVCGEPSFNELDLSDNEWNQVSGQCHTGLSHNDHDGIDQPSSWYHEDFDGAASTDPNCGGSSCDKIGVTRASHVFTYSQYDDEEYPQYAVYETEVQSGDFEGSEMCTTEMEELIDQGDMDWHDFPDEAWYSHPFPSRDNGWTDEGEDVEVWSCVDPSNFLFLDNPSECSLIDWGPYEDTMVISGVKAEERFFDSLGKINGKDLESPAWWDEDAVVETSFVGDSGWNIRYKSFFDSEGWPFLPKGSTSCYEGGDEYVCHIESNWDNRDIANSEAYQGEEVDFTEHREAWIENPDVTGQPQAFMAGADNTDISTPEEIDIEETSSEQYLFPGGFSPECEEGLRWRYVESNDQWECSGSMLFDAAIHLPETGGLSFGTEIGLIIPPFMVMDDADDYPDYVRDQEWVGLNVANLGTESEPQIIEGTEFEAVCTPGGVDDIDDHLEGEEGVDYIRETGTTSSDEPFGIAGDVEEMENYDSYACRVEEFPAEYTSGSIAGEELNVAELVEVPQVEVHFVHEDDDASEWVDEYSGWELSYNEGSLSSQSFIN